jgi:hypothetical protein
VTEPKHAIMPATMAHSEQSEPDTELVPPVHELVQDTYDVIRSEIRILRAKQKGGVALHPDDVLRLQRLMNALAKAHKAQLDAIEAEDLSKLDRAQLVAELRKEMGGGVLKTG